MKIRNRHLVRAAGWSGAAVGRALVGSLRVRHHCEGPDVADGRLAHPDRFVYSIWHEHLLLPAVRFGGPDLAVLISSHADGRLLGSLIDAMGMTQVLGSTTRGGIEAVRQLVRPVVTWKNLAVTPDGPRGPRRVVQQGIVYIASRTGMKIVPIGVGYRDPWRLRSWDRFAVPMPLTPARCILGVPMKVPPNLRSAGLEEYRQLVQTEMDRLTRLAEGWVRTGHLDRTPAGLPSRRAA